MQTADEGPSPEQRCVRKRLLPGGMVKLELVLAPDEADLVMRAVDRARELSAQSPRQGRAVEPEAPPADPSAETPEESPAWPSRADGAMAVTLDDSLRPYHVPPALAGPSSAASLAPARSRFARNG